MNKQYNTKTIKSDKLTSLWAKTTNDYRNENNAQKQQWLSLYDKGKYNFNQSKTFNDDHINKSTVIRNLKVLSNKQTKQARRKYSY